LKVIIGADHGGYEMKDEIATYLRDRGMEVRDLGTSGPGRVLVDGYAVGVGRGVAAGEFDTGVLVCGTGQGMAIFANRVQGVRAALCNDIFTARMARQNNDANVLCMGSEIVGAGNALAIVEEWLQAKYLGREDDTLAGLDELESD